ncbi:hypothetical protein F5Y14DRAFT_83267 [Nemania sp. NC0429]|nr:hypothetical protein F5Y14DRAFT_83267 [Nemania sp. NC0429]
MSECMLFVVFVTFMTFAMFAMFVIFVIFVIRLLTGIQVFCLSFVCLLTCLLILLFNEGCFPSDHASYLTLG